jgi:hypothetical protein
MGEFEMARLVLSFSAATYFWWRFFAATFRAFRTLHRLNVPRAALGFVFGGPILLSFVLFIVVPFFGTGYAH